MTIKQIIKKYNNDYEKILNLYMKDKLYLTSYQVAKFIKLRGEKKYKRMILKNNRVMINNEC